MPPNFISDHAQRSTSTQWKIIQANIAMDLSAYVAPLCNVCSKENANMQVGQYIFRGMRCSSSRALICYRRCSRVINLVSSCSWLHCLSVSMSVSLSVSLCLSQCRDSLVHFAFFLHLSTDVAYQGIQCTIHTHSL